MAAVDPNWKGVDDAVTGLLFAALKLDPNANVVAFCCPLFWLLPKTNMLLALLLLLLLALPVPKAVIAGLDVPNAVVVAGVCPNGDLASPNAVLPPLLAVPNARLVEP